MPRRKRSKGYKVVVGDRRLFKENFRTKAAGKEAVRDAVRGAGQQTPGWRGRLKKYSKAKVKKV